MVDIAWKDVVVHVVDPLMRFTLSRKHAISSRSGPAPMRGIGRDLIKLISSLNLVVKNLTIADGATTALRVQRYHYSTGWYRRL